PGVVVSHDVAPALDQLRVHAQDTAVDVDLLDGRLLASELARDRDREIERVAEQATLAGLDGLRQPLAREGVLVDHRERYAVEGEAARVLQPDGQAGPPLARGGGVDRDLLRFERGL